MAAVHRDIRQLFPWVGRSVIRIKVFRRSEVSDFSGVKELNFIFVDQYGKKIHANVKGNNIHHFRFALPKGEWREISNFKLTSENWLKSENLITQHDYMIFINHETEVRPLDPLSDNHFLEFTEFEKGINGRHDPFYTLDLIGVITYMGKLSLYTRILDERRSIPFHLPDDRNMEHYCIAYGELAVELYEKWKSTDRTNIIGVLSEWKITRSNGEFIVVDAGGLSRIWLDPNIAEAEAMKERLGNQNK